LTAFIHHPDKSYPELAALVMNPALRLHPEKRSGHKPCHLGCHFDDVGELAVYDRENPSRLDASTTSKCASRVIALLRIISHGVLVTFFLATVYMLRLMDNNKT
jgi:hypothetical protein